MRRAASWAVVAPAARGRSEAGLASMFKHPEPTDRLRIAAAQNGLRGRSRAPCLFKPNAPPGCLVERASFVHVVTIRHDEGIAVEPPCWRQAGGRERRLPRLLIRWECAGQRGRPGARTLIPDTVWQVGGPSPVHCHTLPCLRSLPHCLPPLPQPAPHSHSSHSCFLLPSCSSSPPPQLPYLLSIPSLLQFLLSSCVPAGHLLPPPPQPAADRPGAAAGGGGGGAGA